MIITYEDTARSFTLDGNGWKAHHFIRGKRDTNIIHEMWQTIENNTNAHDLETLYIILREAYSNKKSKSRCDIHHDPWDKTLEINNGNMFPNILIQAI